MKCSVHTMWNECSHQMNVKCHTVAHRHHQVFQQVTVQQIIAARCNWKKKYPEEPRGYTDSANKIIIDHITVGRKVYLTCYLYSTMQVGANRYRLQLIRRGGLVVMAPLGGDGASIKLFLNAQLTQALLTWRHLCLVISQHIYTMQ